MQATKGPDIQALNQYLPDHIQTQIQQQHGSIPNWSQSCYRQCTVLSSPSSASGTGGGVLSLKSHMPHHCEWFRAQIQQPNSDVPITFDGHIPPPSHTFCLSLSHNDHHNEYLCIPLCPDATMLSEQQNSLQLSSIEVQQLTLNMKNCVDLVDHIEKPLSFIETYLQLVCGSLGSEILPIPPNLLSNLRAKQLYNFSIKKDLIAFPSGNMIELSIGRVTHTKSSIKLTQTVIIEIQIIGCTSLGHDPLLFQTLFQQLIPPVHQFIWRYANSPMGASKTYRYSDIVPRSYHSLTLHQLYTKFLHPQALPTSESRHDNYIIELKRLVVGTEQQQQSQQNVLPPQNPETSIDNDGNLLSDTSLYHSIAIDNTDLGVIPGVCILPSMTTIFQQYHLSHVTFYPEHLALMYMQIFLHPHIVIK